MFHFMKCKILVFLTIGLLISIPFFVSLGRSSSQGWYGYGDSVFLFKDGDVLGVLYYQANYTLFVEKLSSGENQNKHLTGNVSRRITFQSFGNATHDSPMVYIRSVNSTVSRTIGAEQGSNTSFTIGYQGSFNLTSGETWSYNESIGISSGPYLDNITQPYFYIQRNDTLEAVMADGSRWISNSQILFFGGEITAEPQEKICHLFQSYQVADEVIQPTRELVEDYEGLQDEYESLQEDYTELYENYTNLQDNYLNLNESYHTLAEDYDETNSDYTTLLDDYESLNSSYKDLQSEYYSIQSDYNSLNKTNEELQSKYTLLQGKYESLESDYQTLRSNYTSLQGRYAQLQSKFESANRSLSTTKTIIYVFIGSTVILALVSVYLTINMKRKIDFYREAGGEENNSQDTEQ